jgi:Asp-tRNA(Asn)/Glu-tRNA(Gln) amidotransferase A subunit family amidase
VADINPFASATELLAALRAGRVTSRDLTELYIRRLERGVLLGLLIALKESFNVACLETASGLPEWKGYDR